MIILLLLRKQVVLVKFTIYLILSIKADEFDLQGLSLQEFIKKVKEKISKIYDDIHKKGYAGIDPSINNFVVNIVNGEIYVVRIDLAFMHRGETNKEVFEKDKELANEMIDRNFENLVQRERISEA